MALKERKHSTTWVRDKRKHADTEKMLSENAA
jgi:hypothetical protein